MPAHADNPNEYFDTFTEEGECLTPKPRAHVHANGIWHRAVNVLLYRSTGELILQQRAAAKTVCPLAWDLSVAEHLQVNEDWEIAAHRGLKEELGITKVTLSQCGPEIQERHDDPKNGIRNYEFQQFFRGISDSELLIDTAEVAAVRAISPTEFASEAQRQPQLFTPWFLTWAKILGLVEN